MGPTTELSAEARRENFSVTANDGYSTRAFKPRMHGKYQGSVLCETS